MLPASIADLVRAQPEPPRAVDATAILRDVLLQRSAQFLIALGLVFAAFGYALAFWRLGASSESDARFGFIVIAFGAVVTSSPLVLWWRLLRASRVAFLVTATILDLQFTDGSRDTIEASYNGMARGTWMVRNGSLEFREPFEIDAPWAAQLRVGTKVDVLAYSGVRKTLFAVAIQLPPNAAEADS